MKARSTGSGGFRAAYYTDEDYLYNDDDMDYIPPARKKILPLGGGGKERPGLLKRPAAQSPPPGAGGQSTSPGKAVRSRPTNNQLLYKAYFRWAHYPHKLKNVNLAEETDACASVTAAFLQVLQIMQTAEQLRNGNNKRNVLQILSSNTRRTKVVELSSGTHRVPDELKKHYLSDGEGGQYSTNLDRNRYGNDDNYLFTVIRYDLEFLGLCPCMVDVEIIDAKQGNTSIIVSAGTEVCTCQGGPPIDLGPGGVTGPGASGPSGLHTPHPRPHHSTAGATAGSGGHHQHHQHHHLQAAATVSGSGQPAAVKADYAGLLGPHGHMSPGGPGAGSHGGYMGTAGVGGGVGPLDMGSLPQLFGSGAVRSGAALGVTMGRESPKRSGTSVSQLFDALVMAATGGADGAAAGGGLGGEPPVNSPAHTDRPERGGGGTMGAGGGARHHGPPGRNKSKLWSINNLSFGGEVDSLQNALDAFREQDEIASGDPAAFLTAGASAGLCQDGSLQRSDSLRQRRRKPLRNSSVLGRPASSGGVGPPGSKLVINLREKSDDNLKLTGDPDHGGPLTGAGLCGGASYLPGGGGLQLPVGPCGATQVSSLVSGEDDNDGGGGDPGDADDVLAAKGEELGVEGEGEAGGEEEGQDDGPSGGGQEGEGRAGGGGGGGFGPTASGTIARASGLPAGRGTLRHHVRHVPRQSSVANMGPRVANSGGAGGPGAGGLGGLGMLGPSGLGGSASAAIAGEQLRRLANELESMRHENRSLRQQLHRANSSNGGGGGGGSSPSLGGKQHLQPQHSDNHVSNDSSRLRKLEGELSAMRNDFMVLSAAKRTADEENKQLKRDLLASQQQVAVLLSRVLGANAAVSPLPISAVAGLLAGLLGPLAGAVAAPIGPPAPMQGVTTGAFDPSCFTAHLMALRQAIPQQQQMLLQQQQLLSVGGAGGEAVATNEGRASSFGGAGSAMETMMMLAAAGAAAGGCGRPLEHEVADRHGLDVGAHPSLRKRTAGEAGLALVGGAAEVDEAGAGAEGPARRGYSGVLAAASRTAQHQMLPSMPNFSPAVQGGHDGGVPSLNAYQTRPADSGAAGTPADSTCFSDVAQLLTLPNLDGGFGCSSVELATVFGGTSGGTTATCGLGGAATSGVQALATGSGSGSGTASVPQMPQPEHQVLGLSGHYGGVQQRGGFR